MKQAKRQIAFGLTFGLAATVLLADRLFILPKGAEANGNTPDTTARSALLLETSEAPPIISKTQQVAQRLEKLCPSDRILQEKLPDALALSESWLKDVDPSGSLMGRTNRVIEFTSRYELVALADNKGSGVAFVNNHRIRVGQVLDGFTLIAVDDKSATFEADGLRFKLHMKEDR